MLNVDVIAGLDMLAQRGEWEKCIENAQQQVSISYLLKIVPLIYYSDNLCFNFFSFLGCRSIVQICCSICSIVD